MSRTKLAKTATFILALIIACSGDKSTHLAARGTPCLSNDECFPGEICEGEVCVGVCNVRTDCDTGERCENARCVVVVACGNAALDAGEECDDGNDVRGDGCSPECETDPKYSPWVNVGPCSNTCGDGVRPQERTCVRSDGVVLECSACPNARCTQNNNCTGRSSCEWAKTGACQVSADDDTPYTCGESGYAPIFCYSDANGNKKFDPPGEPAVNASLCPGNPPSQTCTEKTSCAYTSWMPLCVGTERRTFSRNCEAPDHTVVSCTLCNASEDAVCDTVTCRCGGGASCPP